MKKAGIFLLLLLWGLVLLCQVITIVTEDYPPYNYTKNDKITGVSTEVVEAVLKETGMKGEFKVYPWKRSYTLAETEENVLIYSIGRNKERETKFKWVGVIAPYDVYMFSLLSRNDIKISNIEEGMKYKTGTTASDARETYLIGKGFKIGEQIDNTATNPSNLEKLLVKRIDLWPIAELVAYYLVEEKGLKPDKVLRKSYHITDLSSDGLYLAFSKSTSDEIVQRFRDSLNKIKKNGTYSKILKKYNIKS